MRKNVQLLIFTALLPLLGATSSCALKDLEDLSATGDCMSSGDIIVSNSGTDAVIVLDSDGNYKNTALTLTSNAENIYGVHWDRISNRLLVVIDGVDRIVSIDPATCAKTDFVTDPNLTGNLRGLVRLTAGDVLVTETNTVERFTVNANGTGTRTTLGGFPLTLQTNGTGISETAAGGFVECGSASVRTYTAAGVAVSANTVSGITGTTAAMDCRVLKNGNIAVVWSGTTDTVRIYNSALSSTVGSYSDISLLSTPGGIAQRANGNLLVLDRVLNQIIEITETGVFVQALPRSVLSTPEFIEVVP